jgi:galactokinase/mevalonate kinase-like predicted kinase
VSATFEASAPCRVDLAAGPDAVCVAIDRRAWCRVETGVDGLVVESKDALQRLQAAGSSGLDRAVGPVALVREALRALGLESGLQVSTQVRVPSSSGLGGDAALAVALLGGLGRAAGRDLDPEDLVRLAGRVVASVSGDPPGEADLFAARHGGCVAVGAAGRAEPLRVDPAAVEECLLLVDTTAGRGPADGAPTPIPETAEEEGHGTRVREALRARRFDDLARALDADWTSRSAVPGWLTGDRERLAGLLRPAGAALRACGAGRGSVLAIVAAPGPRGPGPRESVVHAAREASVRLFPARVDLLGLDVEKTG